MNSSTFPILSTQPSVILLGASVRSLARSAVSRGWRVYCSDFFQDSDLQQLLHGSGNTLLKPLSSFHESLRQLAHLPRDIPVVWCGGLENSPQLLEQLAEQRPLLGSTIASIRGVRNPARLLSLLRSANLKVPASWFPGSVADLQSTAGRDISDHSGDNDINRPAIDRAPGVRPFPGTIRWLVKPAASAGGQNIVRLPRNRNTPYFNPKNFQDGCPETPDFTGSYLQEEISGVPMSATFLSAPNVSPTPFFLGACLQLSGLRSLNAPEFQHCGNIGPIEPPSSIRTSLQLAANVIHQAFPMRGLFGIDFILHYGEPVFLEVNPRPTASHQHLDALFECPLIELHVNACTDGASQNHSQPLTVRRDAHQEVSCSLVVYASAKGTGANGTGLENDFAGESLRLSETEVNRLLESAGVIADIPQPGTPIRPGTPFMSVHVRSSSVPGVGRAIRSCQLPDVLRSHINTGSVAEEVQQLVERLLDDFRQHCKP